MFSTNELITLNHIRYVNIYIDVCEELKIIGTSLFTFFLSV